VLLMLEETIITETPPLYSRYGHSGEQIQVPITGNRAKRILHGVLHVSSGELLLLITEEWTADTHQLFLQMIRSHGRGWHMVLLEDRGTPHTAAESRNWAARLGIEVRLLPRATPEWNAMDQWWRRMKAKVLANQPTRSMGNSAEATCRYLLGLSRRERLRQAGVLSGRFWLTQ
jgi:DDE superfamily endonuclease